MLQNIKKGLPFGKREWILCGVCAVILVVGALSATRLVSANADYICTKVVDDMSDCGNGAWGDWQAVSTSDNQATCTRATVSERLYTGTRTSKHTFSYLNLRTACEAGYEQAVNGEGGGASGFHGGSIVTQTSACQIQQTATARNPLSNGTCASHGAFATSTSVDSTTADLGATDTQTKSAGSINDLNSAYNHMSGARLMILPSLVHAHDTTVVTWKSQVVVSCSVTGTNGDHWEGLTGKNRSSPIIQKTSYTLTCVTLDGTPLTETASVDIIPSWQEI